MSKKELNVRIRQKFDTEENWNNSNIILLQGELAFVVDSIENPTSVKIKTGDGVRLFSELPYVNQDSNPIQIQEEIGTFEFSYGNGNNTKIFEQAIVLNEEAFYLLDYTYYKHLKVETKNEETQEYETTYTYEVDKINSGYSISKVIDFTDDDQVGKYCIWMNGKTYNGVFLSSTVLEDNWLSIDDKSTVKISKINIVLDEHSDNTELISILNTNSLSSGFLSSVGGAKNLVLGAYSRSDGKNNFIRGQSSYATGEENVVNGHYNLVAGSNNKVEGTESVVIGNRNSGYGIGTIVSGMNNACGDNYSVVHGLLNQVLAENAFVTGYSNYNCSFGSLIAGKLNALKNQKTTAFNLRGNVFILGNGCFANGHSRITTENNAFRVSYLGDGYFSRNVNSFNTGYGELYEWEDGNPTDEDRIGKAVTLKGNKLVLAKENDWILGVVSSNLAFAGNVADEVWHGMYERDVFGRILFYDEPIDSSYEETPVGPTIDGTIEVNENNEIVVTENTTTPEKVIDFTNNRGEPSVNTAFNPDLVYKPRTSRPEWDYVTMTGRVIVTDDGTCVVDEFCKINNDSIATKIENNGTSGDTIVLDKASGTNTGTIDSYNSTGYRVIERLDATHIVIILK